MLPDHPRPDARCCVGEEARPPRTPRLALLHWRWLAPLALGTTLGCVDVRAYEGAWEGAVVEDPAVRVGFAAETRVDELLLDDLTLHSVSATLSTSDGRLAQTALQPVARSNADALASLTFDGDPLHSYVLWAPLSGDASGSTALVLLSLFDNDRVELRIIDRDQLFGVFLLRRKRR